jgi:tetratricopeptide (TPR) repeat protein
VGLLQLHSKILPPPCSSNIRGRCLPAGLENFNLCFIIINCYNYTKRISLGGWNEEVWYSYYKIGSCYKNMNKMADAITTWLDGYNFYPDRLEGLYEIIHYYRNKSKHKLCNIFYELAKKILDKNLSRNQCLFLYNDVYTYKLYYEYTIFSSYIGEKNINNEIIHVLNNCKDGNIINNVLNFITH